MLKLKVTFFDASGKLIGGQLLIQLSMTGILLIDLMLNLLLKKAFIPSDSSSMVK
ncbi:MAG: hypothetical protein IPO48_21065 [Saprospiraceae bacterium]|nr:hypothetical protein [Saprospiraceae bacterium]